MTEFRHIGWPEYGQLTEALAEKVLSSGKSFDLTVGIARGGIPVALVVSDRLGVKVDFMNVKSYSGIGERTQPRILSTLTEDIRGKSVLLVDDLVDHGVTINMLKQHLSDMGPRLLETAVLFRKPWSKAEPDYYLETSDKWIVFPFEVGEVSRQRQKTDENLDSKK